MKPQTQLVYNLITKRDLSAAQARAQFGVENLSARVAELRHHHGVQVYTYSQSKNPNKVYYGAYAD